MSQLLKVTIDGRTIEMPAKSTILEAKKILVTL